LNSVENINENNLNPKKNALQEFYYALPKNVFVWGHRDLGKWWKYFL